MSENAQLLDEFCDALWLEDGLSRNSLESYRRDLRIFSAAHYSLDWSTIKNRPEISPTAV